MHVLGLGPIGCLVAHHLRRALPTSQAVSVIHRTRQRAEKARWENIIKMETGGTVVNTYGLRHEVCPPLALLNEEPTEAQARAEAATSSLPPIQSLIVCVKTHHTLPGIQALTPRITPSSTIVLLQNGMGVYEQLVDKFFRDPEQRPNFVLGCITHGAWLKNFLHVVHAGIGEIQLGIVPSRESDFERSYPDLSLDDIAPDPEVDPNHRHSSLRSTIAALTSLNALNVSWRPLDQVQLLMRRKLVVNSVINPLTALMNCQNGELFQHEQARTLAFLVCREAAKAFHSQYRAGIAAAKFAGEEGPFQPFPASLGAKELMNETMRVAQLTKENYSSMLTDIKMGRGTEIHGLNGYLVALGKQYDLRMHTNRTLAHLVQLRSSIPLSSL